MARRIFEFICVGDEPHTFEKYTDENNRTAVCPQCGELSNRIISPSLISLEGYSGNYPGAAMKWVKQRKEKLRQEQKQNAE